MKRILLHFMEKMEKEMKENLVNIEDKLIINNEKLRKEISTVNEKLSLRSKNFQTMLLIKDAYQCIKDLLLGQEHLGLQITFDKLFFVG